MSEARLRSLVFKHLSGQHNQKKHGHRGASKVSHASMAVGYLEYSPSPEMARSIENSILASASDAARPIIIRQIESELAQIARDHPVGVRVPYDSAVQILESGRVKTQFETGTSQGMYSTKLRSRAEDYGLGLPRDLAPEKRPVYGYFMGAAENDGASGYGEIVFELKPKIKDRTTITQGDSLNGFADGKQIGTPARNPTIGSVKFDDHYKNNPMIKQGYRKDEYSLDRNIEYFEAQIYGGVSTKDIMFVRFGAECFNPKTMQLTDKYADLAESFYQAGIDVEISRPFNQDIFSVKEFALKEFDPYLSEIEETLGVNLVGFWDAYQKSDKKDETWTEGFLKALAAGIIAAYLLGRGGADEELSEDELALLQEYIEEQSQYLDGFALAAFGLSPAMGAARAGLYAAALTLPFWWGRTRDLDLPAYPGDGSSECLTRCRCQWEIVPIDEDAGDYDCTWRLGFAEHCPTCQARSAAWNPLQVRGWNYSTSQKEVLEATVLKHLGGQHNQKTHGWRHAEEYDDRGFIIPFYDKPFFEKLTSDERKKYWAQESYNAKISRLIRQRNERAKRDAQKPVDPNSPEQLLRAEARASSLPITVNPVNKASRKGIVLRSATDQNYNSREEYDAKQSAKWMESTLTKMRRSGWTKEEVAATETFMKEVLFIRDSRSGMSVRPLETSALNIDPHKRTIQIDGYISRNGDDVGTITRELNFNGLEGRLEIVNTSLSIDRAHQGTGFATRFYENQEHVATKIGAGAIRTHANHDIGGYTWAKMGYSFSDNSERGKIFSQFEAAWRSQYKSDPPSQYKDMAENGTLQPWHLAMARGPSKVLSKKISMRTGARKISQTTQIPKIRKGTVKAKYEEFGKNFMLGSNWNGVKRLSNQDTGFNVGQEYYETKP